MHYLDTLKKIVVLSVAVLSVSIIYTSNTNAANEGVLQQIADNTFGTLRKAEEILSLMVQESADSMGSGAPDDGRNGQYSFIKANQNLFRQLGEDLAKSQELQDNDTTQQFANLLGVSVNELKPFLPSMPAPILDKLPGANDLAYASVIGRPPAQKGAFKSDNYLKYAAGVNFRRPIPDGSWQGKEDDRKKYSNYFSSITAIQSFNSYVLSQLKSDYEADKDPTISGLRNQLIRQTSDPGYIAQIAGESMGKVMRQLLLFTSQNFILNTQIQTSMRQLVAASAMQSSLMILLNQQNENQLIRNAKGLPLGR